MQMSDAVEVKQIFGDDRVNALLAEGWKLLTVVASTYGDGKDNVVRPCYVLGKPKAPVLSPGVLVGKAKLKQ
ncbi:hypothetical protein [Pseudomonas fulva]|uniref:hypothetical protein n=1 Tax=Pseudomonas fulva TaxID=47880 RepID=UPI0015E48284|nr:hypothetical protein [Pseudomonas fulva]MBA1218176.1 hypothetical protein [Pseudomonas fulva]